MSELSSKKCIPCEAGTPPMNMDTIRFYINQVPGWDDVEGHHILKKFKFINFAEALEFVNRIGAIAEDEGHHPDIELSWGLVVVRLYTHKVGGLSDNDFIMAAKIDEAYNVH